MEAARSPSWVRGVTTNPVLLAKAGGEARTVLESLARLEMQEVFCQLVFTSPERMRKEMEQASKIRGDLHDIGKNLVALMLEGAGLEVKDLGMDVPPKKFVEAIAAGDVHILALSALLTATMSNMKTAIETIQQAGMRDKSRS